MDDPVDVKDVNDRPDKPSAIEIQVFPMREDKYGSFVCADNAEEAQFWDILVRAIYVDDKFEDDYLVDEFENLTFAEADAKALELSEKYDVEVEWVNC